MGSLVDILIGLLEGARERKLGPTTDSSARFSDLVDWLDDLSYEDLMSLEGLLRKQRSINEAVRNLKSAIACFSDWE